MEPVNVRIMGESCHKEDFTTVAENDKKRAVVMLNSWGYSSTEQPDWFYTGTCSLTSLTYLTLLVSRIPLLRTACTISLRAESGNISGTYTPEPSCGMYFTNRAVRWAVPQAIGDDGIRRRRNSNIDGNRASQRMRHDRPCLSPYTKTARANRSLCRIPCCTKVVIATGVGVGGNRTGLSPRD